MDAKTEIKSIIKNVVCTKIVNKITKTDFKIVFNNSVEIFTYNGIITGTVSEYFHCKVYLH